MVTCLLYTSNGCLFLNEKRTRQVLLVWMVQILCSIFSSNFPVLQACSLYEDYKPLWRTTPFEFFENNSDFEPNGFQLSWTLWEANTNFLTLRVVFKVLHRKFWNFSPPRNIYCTIVFHKEWDNYIIRQNARRKNTTCEKISMRQKIGDTK